MLTTVGNISNNNHNIHRIGKNTLLRLININDYKEYLKYKSQYILNNSNIWDKTVWVDVPYSKRLNRVYSNTGLLKYSDYLSTKKEHISTCIEVMLQQGYDFNNIFGIHVLLINLDTNEVLNSQIITENDFKITSDKLLIDGSFWMQSYKIYIPKITGNLCAQITEIDYDNISLESTNIGTIYNFPEELIPIKIEKPMVSSLNNVIELDDNFYLNIKLVNEDTKTIKQTILDYFGIDYTTSNEIRIQHIINYGNPTVGYKELIVANTDTEEDNIYNPISVGLNFSFIANSENKRIEIIVTTQIIVNNLLMERIATLSVNMGEIINPFISSIIKLSQTNYPVNVEIINNIEQTVVKQNKQVRFITIQQPIYAQLIVDSFRIENKNIVFSNLSVPANLIINKTKSSEEQNISSKILADGTIYFDISDLIPVSEETTYQLLDKYSMKIIGQGKVLP